MTVAVDEPRLNSATVTLPSGLCAAQTCWLVEVDTGRAGRAAWSTAITSVLVSRESPKLSSLVRSSPEYSGADSAAQNVITVCRSSLVMPSIAPTPTSTESMSAQVPGPMSPAHSVRSLKRAFTEWSQVTMVLQ